MELSPRLYHAFVRSTRLTQKYIHNILEQNFDFHNKTVLDFGSGIGSNSCMCNPENYLGIDPDAKRVAYAKRLYPGFNFTLFEGNRLPVANDSVDYILIVAVLHHIPPEQLPGYLDEFRRVLKPYGRIVVMEPCLFNNSRFRNWFMSHFDRGKFIRTEDAYIQIFTNHHYQVDKLKQFQKMLLYNELLFTAVLE